MNNAGYGAGRYLKGPPKILGCEKGATRNLKSNKGAMEITKQI